MQLELLADIAPLPPLARRADPPTSHAAADQAHELAARHGRVIVECLKRHGPASKDRIASLTNLTAVQTARRLPELQRAGKVRPTGKTVPSTSGRAEREWEACA